MRPSTAGHSVDGRKGDTSMNPENPHIVCLPFPPQHNIKAAGQQIIV